MLQNCKITGSCFLVVDSIFLLIFLSLPNSASIQSHTLIKKNSTQTCPLLQVVWYCHVLINVFGLVPRTAREGDFVINCLSSDILIYWQRSTEGRFYTFYSDVNIRFLHMVSIDMFTAGTRDNFSVSLLQFFASQWHTHLFLFKQVRILQFWFRLFSFLRQWSFKCMNRTIKV